MSKNGVLEAVVINGIRVDLTAHAAALSAHTQNLWQTMRTGAYFRSPYVNIRAQGTRALTANTLYAVPYPVARATTWDRIACHVTAQAGEKFRLGIYNDGTNLYPGTLLLDAGEITLSGTGVQAITISQALSKGLYWLAIVSNGTPTLRMDEDNSNGPLGMLATDFQASNGRWAVAFTYAALPDPFTAGGALDFYPVPSIALRLLTLD